ncbi:MAG: 3-hydroxyacyl-CoA dehydrogenase/enoyl-CoA hydratase family protein, partial [bacterium]|nr:3-hydroxyacyl-CoA dehydrogenase/enoyl-CoA hydratase family protein [bacterium]
GDAEKAFQLIGLGRVSTSAENARELGFLAAADSISMNRERLVADAKRVALSLAPIHHQLHPRTAVPVGGKADYAKLKLTAWMARQAEQISEYDLVIAEKLAHILSGGKLVGKQTVSEQHLLDLEREAFLSLCGNRKTQERIQHMLKKGKPLRN